MQEKKIKGKKRHLLLDTQGLLMQAIVHSADVQDRDDGVLLLSTLLGRFPYLEKMFADSAYQGPIFAGAVSKILSRLQVEIVKRSDQAKGFVVLPKELRWKVGDGVNQAADFILAASSIPSLNFTPSTTFGNRF